MVPLRRARNGPASSPGGEPSEPTSQRRRRGRDLNPRPSRTAVERSAPPRRDRSAKHRIIPPPGGIAERSDARGVRQGVHDPRTVTKERTVAPQTRPCGWCPFRRARNGPASSPGGEPSEPTSQRWRRGRDLNPRGSSKPPTRLAGERLRPLGHLSKCRQVISPSPSAHQATRPPWDAHRYFRHSPARPRSGRCGMTPNRGGA